MTRTRAPKINFLFRRRSREAMGELDRQIEAAYDNEGIPLKQSAKKIGISYQYMIKRAHWMGIKRRRNPLTSEEEFWIWQLHRIHKLTLDSIAEKFECSRSGIYSVVQRQDKKWADYINKQGEDDDN